MTTVDQRGRVTIPKRIRERLGLRPGQKIKFFLAGDGRVVLLPVLPISSLRGIVEWRGPPISLEQMDDAIAAGATEGFELS